LHEAAFPLDAYLARIGLVPPLAPDRAALCAIIRHHAAAIPFESIDPFLGRGVRIDLPTLTDKLIHRRRGGYCFEQNLLLLGALRVLGYQAEPRLARVIRGQPDDAMTPRTHVMLRVDLPEGPVLADAGFGNLTPTAPLDFATDAPQATAHEAFRLVPLRHEWVLRARVGDEWQSLYRLGPETPAPADLEVANWFTATHPASPFTGNLVVARPVEGGRHTLFNTRHAHRTAAGVVVTHLSDAIGLGRVLAGAFGLELPAADLAMVFAAVAGRPEDARFRGYFS